MTTAFIVEDDPRLRSELAFMLRDEGFGVTAVESAEEAFDRLTTADDLPDFLILDVRLPGESGVDLVRRLVAVEKLPPTIVVSGEASIAEAVEALKLGVHDFLEKPIHRERLLRSLRIMLDQSALRQRVARLESKLGLSTAILGKSKAIGSLKEQIAQVAPTEARVLIRGESGSGKELVADAIHAGSDRRDRPLVKINCAAIAPQLVEDELFGHVRGAFTDASADKPGLFEEADSGTLFLDEIGDMDRKPGRTPGRCASDCRDAREPGGGGRTKAIPAGPLLSSGALADRRTAASRAERRRAGSVRALSRSVLRAQPPTTPAVRAGRCRAPGPVGMAGKRA
jgi:DNA-binding NtrC family response regulator